MTGKILVVDDDPSTLRFMRLLLTAEGFAVATAQDAQEGLRAVQTEQPDLIILDIMMPDMDGMDMCRQLRSRPDTADIPIIFLTAKVQLDDRVAGLKAGADDYITKPAEPREIVARVEAVLARTRRAPPARQGRVVALIGAKGGMGTSTMAVNLAVALEQRQLSTLLIDLHHYCGTIAQQLKLAVRSSLTDLLALEPNQIDGQQVQRVLMLHPSGARALLSPPAGAGLIELPVGHATAIVRGAKLLSDIVLLDLPHVPSPALKEVLSLSDMALIVLEPEPIPVACAEQTLSLLEEAGLIGEAVGLIVVNHTQSVTSLPLADIERTLNKSCLGVIPPAFAELAHSDHHGTPVILSKPQSMVSISLRELAERVQTRVSSLGLYAR